MSKKGIGILLIIIGILGGLYLYVLVGFWGASFAGGLVYGGYKLYTNNNFTGKPFAKGTFTYSSYSKSFSGSISFEMIKTTNVYCRII